MGMIWLELWKKGTTVIILGRCRYLGLWMISMHFSPLDGGNVKKQIRKWPKNLFGSVRGDKNFIQGLRSTCRVLLSQESPFRSASSISFPLVAHSSPILLPSQRSQIRPLDVQPSICSKYTNSRYTRSLLGAELSMSQTLTGAGNLHTLVPVGSSNFPHSEIYRRTWSPQVLSRVLNLPVFLDWGLLEILE